MSLQCARIVDREHVVSGRCSPAVRSARTRRCQWVDAWRIGCFRLCWEVGRRLTSAGPVALTVGPGAQCLVLDVGHDRGGSPPGNSTWGVHRRGVTLVRGERRCIGRGDPCAAWAGGSDHGWTRSIPGTSRRRDDGSRRRNDAAWRRSPTQVRGAAWRPGGSPPRALPVSGLPDLVAAVRAARVHAAVRGEDAGGSLPQLAASNSDAASAYMNGSLTSGGARRATSAPPTATSRPRHLR